MAVGGVEPHLGAGQAAPWRTAVRRLGAAASPHYCCCQPSNNSVSQNSELTLLLASHTTIVNPHTIIILTVRLGKLNLPLGVYAPTQYTLGHALGCVHYTILTWYNRLILSSLVLVTCHRTPFPHLAFSNTVPLPLPPIIYSHHKKF